MSSMWPLIRDHDQIGEIIPSNHYRIDDIVVFKTDDKLIAHRIIYLPPHLPDHFITKGDNNSTSDTPIHRSQILGEAIILKRDKKLFKIDSFYEKQSLNYLAELAKFGHLAKKDSLGYLILKGIPNYQKYTGAYPRHFIYDADILIHPSDLPRVHSILKTLSYTLLPGLPKATEFSATKSVGGLLVSLDIHLEPAVAFSQMPAFNSLLPQIPVLTQELWATSRNHLLTPNHQFVYLLLHALHHTYVGTARWDLITKLSQHKSLDPLACLQIIHKLGLVDLVYGALIFHSHYYQPSKTISTLISALAPRRSTIVAANLMARLIKPWSTHSHLLNRLELLGLLLIISPLSFTRKFSVLLHSITSIDLSIFKKWS